LLTLVPALHSTPVTTINILSSSTTRLLALETSVPILNYIYSTLTWNFD
ncbi:unnamed protein product, partial [Amoebophrya sp. A25]